MSETPENPLLDCKGGHRYFVAETVGVEQEGKVFVIIVCIQCGQAFCHPFKVVEGSAKLALASDKKLEKEQE